MTATSYQQFLLKRRRATGNTGPTTDPQLIHPSLKPFQQHITHWAIEGGRRAIWADTGLGKTRMMIEWARLTSSNLRLIVAPLAVCKQTIREANNIGVDITYIRSASEVVGPGIYITNYEMVPAVADVPWQAIALDEASILKQSTGKTRKMLIETFKDTQYRTTWTATPAPNDPEELTSQAEFLGQMTRNNMLAAYFIHDMDGWRLKGHAINPLIDWLNTWAIAVRFPSDIGDDDNGYVLPGLQIIPEVVQSYVTPDEGELFAASIGGVQGRSKARKETLDDRVARAVDLVRNEPDEQWCLWVGLNAEAEALAKALPEAVNIHGSLTPEEKADGLHAFANGDVKVLITKPSIAAMGLNFQNCARTAFVGMSDSYEQYYQAIRRFYRFGQTRVVHAHIVLSQLEQEIALNVQRKEHTSSRLTQGMITRSPHNIHSARKAS